MSAASIHTVIRNAAQLGLTGADLSRGSVDEVADYVTNRVLAALDEQGFEIVDAAYPAVTVAAHEREVAEQGSLMTQALREAHAMLDAVLDLLDRADEHGGPGSELNTSTDVVRAVMRGALEAAGLSPIGTHDRITGRVG